jgi:hypothetical protein
MLVMGGLIIWILWVYTRVFRAAATRTHGLLLVWLYLRPVEGVPLLPQLSSQRLLLKGEQLRTDGLEEKYHGCFNVSY